jgi:hypothetical protein
MLIRRRFAISLAVVTAFSLLSVAPVVAHHDHPISDGVTDSSDRRSGAVSGYKAQHGPEQGHLPPSSENVDLVGRLDLTNVEGGVSDVAAHGNHAYLGAFFPECRSLGGSGTGVHVVDISDPESPRKVSFIRAHNNSYVGEGVFVMSMSTPHFTGDVLIHNNEPCDGTRPFRGGVSIWDVSNPRSPRPLALEAGDFETPAGQLRRINGKPTAAPSHSAQGWTVNDRAYVAMVNNIELRDVDILDITDPRNPVQIAEVGLPDWPGVEIQGHGDTPFHHDMQINFIEGTWYLLASYWDAGHILLNVDDPADPQFVGQTRFIDPDPFTGLTPPGGNAHQAFWSSDDRFIIGTDEIFDPFRLIATITSGPFAGEEFNAVLTPFGESITPEEPLVGATRFVGLACDAATVPPAQSPDEIAVIERGVCTFQVKTNNIQAAGYAGGIVFNTADPAASVPCEGLVIMLLPDGSEVPMLFVARSTGFRILGIEGYDPARCPEDEADNPSPPAAGTPGEEVNISSVFQGWGYATLYDASTLEPVDAYAIDEAIDPDFAQNFGDLTVHEVKTDPRPGMNLAYFSWYAGGLRVAQFDDEDIEEVGHFIADGGNNFWGVFPHFLPGSNPEEERPLILNSDRDSGLWIFQYTGAEPAS